MKPGAARKNPQVIMRELSVTTGPKNRHKGDGVRPSLFQYPKLLLPIELLNYWNC
jgi:hypothetical protein